jgi:pilus assembly protein CpaB
MNSRRLTLAFLVALAVSGLCTLWFGSRMVRAHGSAPPRSQYLATARPVDAGEILRAEDVKLIHWPDSVPIAGTFTRSQDVVGRTVLYPLGAGEPLQERQLAAAGSGIGLSTKIPDGMRALSLKSDQVVGVAGFLMPGTHVDVLVTYVLPSSSMPVTSMVLQDAQILAAGQKMEPDPQGKPTTVDVVTLLVSPQDAEKAVLASAQGRVHFVMRNGADSVKVSAMPVELAALGQAAAVKPVVKEAPRKPQVAAAPAKYTVQLVNGEKSSTESF